MPSPGKAAAELRALSEPVGEMGVWQVWNTPAHTSLPLCKPLALAHTRRGHRCGPPGPSGLSHTVLVPPLPF